MIDDAVMILQSNVIIIVFASFWWWPVTVSKREMKNIKAYAVIYCKIFQCFYLFLNFFFYLFDYNSGAIIWKASKNFLYKSIGGRPRWIFHKLFWKYEKNPCVHSEKIAPPSEFSPTKIRFFFLLSKCMRCIDVKKIKWRIKYFSSCSHYGVYTSTKIFLEKNIKNSQ